MGHEFRVDPDTLDETATALRKAGDELAGTAAAPSGLDAGELTAAFQRLTDKLTRDAGQVSIGLVAAGETVAKARADYLAQDEKARQRFKN
ncbi:hypothetical protein [Plantactinospora endophytica]|uniref:ESX-1 secretion-associated protein n=1 Tax=Plantactinospora endophytica TaxID=673535 RepID=A0ABQ4DXH8_9ACTN|nr:hypothetical protein [Plantactinospora endophytica]GIG87160.1 hypothetical protein Pen02_20960 [Plantactinospora endophytica]